MSRVGRQPIDLPDGTKVVIDGRNVSVSGSKGKVTVNVPRGVDIALDEKTATVTVDPEKIDTPGAWGLARALLANAVQGTNEGYEKRLLVVGVGYRATVKGKSLEMLLGFSHPVTVNGGEGIEFEVGELGSLVIQGNSQPTIPLVVRGADKQRVGQIAADLRAIRPPEPYKGKGIRYIDEHVAYKAGKTSV